MSNIKAGDLVMVVRVAPCGCPVKLGHMTIVTRIWISLIGTRCPSCGYDMPEPTLYANDASGWFASVRRLKRIPPLSELEGEKRNEEIET